MKEVLTIIQIVSSIVFIALVLVQARGTGLGRGSAASFTRRGLEKLLFKLTFVFAAVFLIVSILQLI
jgi:protein translocase SecG subunit